MEPIVEEPNTYNFSRTLATGKTIESVYFQPVGDEEHDFILFQMASKQQQIETAIWLVRCFPREYKQHIADIITDISKNWAHGDSFYIMANKDAKVVGGFAVDSIKNNEPYLSNLFVIPSMRKRGLAGKMIDFAFQNAQNWDFDYLRLWCVEGLVSFYERYGFTKDTFIDAENVWLMSKRDVSFCST